MKVIDNFLKIRDPETGEFKALPGVISGSGTGSGSGGTVYITAETPTGDIWIDGKPIYRKIVSMAVPTNNTWYFSEGNNTILNFDTLVHVEYMYHLASGSILSGSAYLDSKTQLCLFCKVTDNIFKLSAKCSGEFTGTARAIVYYTKTTD